MPADCRASASAINIGSRISRVLQNLQDARLARRLPHNIMRRRPGERSDRQQQLGLLKMAHLRLGAAKLAELSKQMEQPCLHFFIRIETDTSVPAVRQARRQRQPQLASCRLLPLALVQPQLDLMKLSLAHDPRQAEQQ